MKYILNEEVLNSVLNYLGNRPYVEVMDLVKAVQTAEPLPPEEPKAEEETA